MERVLDVLKEGVIIADQSNHILWFANLVFLKMTGMSRVSIGPIAKGSAVG